RSGRARRLPDPRWRRRARPRARRARAAARPPTAPARAARRARWSPRPRGTRLARARASGPRPPGGRAGGACGRASRRAPPRRPRAAWAPHTCARRRAAARPGRPARARRAASRPAPRRGRRESSRRGASAADAPRIPPTGWGGFFHLAPCQAGPAGAMSRPMEVAPRQDQFDAMIQGLRDSADLLERLGRDVAVRRILVDVLGDLLNASMATVRFVASALLD